MYDRIPYVLPFVCSAAALIVCKNAWYNEKKALFPKLVAVGIGCLALGSLHDVVYQFIHDSPMFEIYLSFLGTIGCFLFLLSANYGQLDRLFDDGSSSFLKYRIAALIVPAVMLALYMPIAFIDDISLGMKVFAFVGWIPMTAASYYNTKHAILPDCGFMFVKVVRPYNAAAIALEFSQAFYIVMNIYKLSTGIWISSIAVSLSVMAVLYYAKKGAEKWTI